MSARRVVASALCATLAFGGSVQAFQWQPFAFPEGDQRYVLEIRQGEGPDATVGTLDLTVVDRGGTYDTTTTLTFEQTGIGGDDLSTAAFGGEMAGLLMMGPMLAYGPAFFLLPMMLGEEDVRVRSEPLRLVGMGSLTMEREEEVAGHTCVVVRFEPDDDPDGAMTFALADGLPFPCYSVYGSGGDRIEVRLLRAEP